METIAASRGPIQSPRAPVTRTPSDPAPQANPMTMPELTAALSGRSSWAFTTMAGIMASHSFSKPIQPTTPTAMRGPMAHPRLPPKEEVTPIRGRNIAERRGPKPSLRQRVCAQVERALNSMHEPGPQGLGPASGANLDPAPS